MRPWSAWPEWLRIILIWTAIGICVLFFGSLAVRAFQALRHSREAGYDPGWGWPFFKALLLFSVGGGITIGLLILVWWRVTPPDSRWGLGAVVLSLLLFALFVWPTPYKYYRTESRDVLIKVNRITGQGDYVPSGSP